MDVLTKASVAEEAGFAEIVGLIAAAHQRAFLAVNTTLIDLYWPLGECISRKIETAEWGDGVVPQLAQYITRTQPGLRDFTRSNLFRMKQFYETYRSDAIVAALPRQLSWTHNLIILGQSKRPEDCEFYLRMAIRERWSSRQLERQFKLAFFEHTVLSPVKAAPAVAQIHPEAQNIFKDAYAVEFLGLPQNHTEDDLQRGLLDRMKDFMLELGRDFCFVGSLRRCILASRGIWKKLAWFLFTQETRGLRKPSPKRIREKQKSLREVSFLVSASR
jgi:predicted nuclease of restriction endonuclease-like (RecB) superfamily